MKKNILKSPEQKSKSLFRFNNSDNKSRKNYFTNLGQDTTTTDPTTATISTISTF